VKDLPTSLSQTKTISSALENIQRRISGTTDTPSLDAQVLLAHVTGRERGWVLAHPEYTLDTEETLRLADRLAQLTAGVPLPYVLGSWEFYGRSFKISPQVLIPRPETELLVETALDWLRAHPGRRKAAEAGTGSGCIAVSLAADMPDLQLVATELSPAAAAIARENAVRHQVHGRVRVLVNDLLEDLPGPFDLIAANLPYIPSNTLRQLPVYRREPDLALDGGEDGLVVIARLVAQAAQKLAPGGLVLLEIEAGQGAQSRSLAAEYFPDAGITVRCDLAGLDRLLVIQT
jgi:release factor glutamine methyltransferase